MADDARGLWLRVEWEECRRTVRQLELGIGGLRMAIPALALVMLPAVLGAMVAGGGRPPALDHGSLLALACVGAVLMLAAAAALDMHWTRVRDGAWLRSVQLEIEGLGRIGTGLGSEALIAAGRRRVEAGWPLAALAGYALAAGVVTAAAVLALGGGGMTAGIAAAAAAGFGAAGLFLASERFLAETRRQKLRVREVARAEPFFTAGEIATGVAAVAAAVKAWLAAEGESAGGTGQPLVVVSIQHGARYFVRDLVRLLADTVTVRVVPVRVISAPGVGVRSAPALEYGAFDHETLGGKAVLIVDDILDSGGTVRFVREQIERFAPASVRSAVFLKKFHQGDVTVDFAAYDLGIRHDSAAQRYWFFGYGMDADGDFRDLPVIGAVDSTTFRKLMDEASR